MAKNAVASLLGLVLGLSSTLVFADETPAETMKRTILENIGVMATNGETGEYWVDLSALLGGVLEQEGELEEMKRARTESEAELVRIRQLRDIAWTQRDAVNEREKVWEKLDWSPVSHPLNAMRSRLEEAVIFGRKYADLIGWRERQLTEWFDKDEYLTAAAFIAWVFEDGAPVPDYLNGIDADTGRIRTGLYAAGWKGAAAARNAGADRARAWLSGAGRDKEGQIASRSRVKAQDSLEEALTAATFLRKQATKPELWTDLTAEESNVLQKLNQALSELIDGINDLLGLEIASGSSTPPPPGGVFFFFFFFFFPLFLLL